VNKKYDKAQYVVVVVVEFLFFKITLTSHNRIFSGVSVPINPKTPNKYQWVNALAGKIVDREQLLTWSICPMSRADPVFSCSSSHFPEKPLNCNPASRPDVVAILPLTNKVVSSILCIKKRLLMTYGLGCLGTNSSERRLTHSRKHLKIR